MKGLREWADDELVLVSAIQHYSYCPRQCALIHREQTFDENLYTLRGRFLHEIVDQTGEREREDVRIVTALSIWSDRYGMTGKCDVVEFHGDRPHPIEYKHGRRKPQVHDELQLCAEAMCLEEMFGVDVPKGAIYHHSSRRRREVEISKELRSEVVKIIEQVRDLNRQTALPAAANDTRCHHCSLHSSCLPEVTDGRFTWRWQNIVKEDWL